MTERQYARLFEAFPLAGLLLKNRLIMPPMTTNFAHRDGRVSARLVDYYVARARGGVGMIIVEPACVDYPRGKGIINQLDISSDEALPGLRALAGAIKEAGAAAALQLHHAGGLRLLAEPIGVPPLAPSRLSYRGYDTPDVMDLRDIRAVQQLFVAAARRAMDAGFDAVEFHGAHAYLICQFLSPLTNRRSDEYGGPLANRMRFFQEIVAQTRTVVGHGFPIICRLSADEYADGGLQLDDAKIIARGLEEAGADAIDVSVSSTPEKSSREIVSNAPVMDLPMGTWLHLAEGIKRACSLPIIAVGRIHAPQLAADILQEGKADLIAVGRALIADPEWPAKVQQGRLRTIRPCLACNTCISRVVRRHLDAACSVNASMGREGSLLRRPADPSRRVLVLGGGPAGLEAALVAAARGHRVAIWERSARLGGQLLPAGAPPFKEGIRDLAAALVNQVESARIETWLDARWTRADILRLAPDAVIVATGSRAALPPVKGVDSGSVVTARQVLRGEAEVGNRVLIVGGAAVGCETADFLALQGKVVTLVEQLPWLAQEMEATRRRLLFARLKAAHVDVRHTTRLLEVTAGGGIVVDLDGRREQIPVDTIVMATEPLANREVLAEVRDVVAEWFVVGDALRPRTLLEAFLEGHMAGCRV